MNEETGKHIHHALCGHREEHVRSDKVGNEVCKIDGSEPTTKTIYQYYRKSSMVISTQQNKRR